MSIVFLTEGETRHALDLNTGDTVCGIPGDELTGYNVYPKSIMSPALQMMKCEDCAAEIKGES